MCIQKQWMAALDERTSVSHRHLDGEIKAVNEKFSNGLMHPGDTAGRPAEVYNCRCTMVPIVNDQLYEGERASKLKDMSYEEWRNAQPKPKSKAKKKNKTAGKQDSNENKTTEIPKNKADLINALESAKREAARDDSKIGEYRAAVKELSENVPFGEFFENQLEKKYIIGLEETLKRAVESHPDFAKMYRSWQCQFSFLHTETGAAYNMIERHVYVNAKECAKGDKISTPYQVFFHELGHLIDNQAASPINSFISVSSRLTKFITSDWAKFRDDISDKLGVSGKPNAHRRNSIAIDYIRNVLAKGDDGKINLMAWAGVSDTIEGCTKVSYPLGAGHGASYHKNKDVTASEFFAEACSAAIANPASFETFKFVFPNAVAELEKIVKELAG